MRLLWVVPRYGARVLGGAEALVRTLATQALPPEWTAEIASTCAVDHVTWSDELPEGTTTEDGVLVHRFPVGPRDPARYDDLHHAVIAGGMSYADELEWLSHSVTSARLDAFIDANAGRFDLMLFAPYLFGTTLWGAQIAPHRSALMPCLHDEPYARLRTVSAVVGAVRGCMFNAPGEERLAHALYAVRDGGVVGMGFDPADPPARDATDRPDEPYIVYAGRMEEGKGVHELVEAVTAMRTAHPGAPRLLLLGKGGYVPPKAARPHVIPGGFVSERDKQWLIAGAVALVSASRMESLSIVQLEAWLHGVPCVVHGGCEVMSDHCATSGGGLAFTDNATFADACLRLADDPGELATMGARGRQYVLDVYGWGPVRRRFRELVERLAP